MLMYILGCITPCYAYRTWSAFTLYSLFVLNIIPLIFSFIPFDIHIFWYLYLIHISYLWYCLSWFFAYLRIIHSSYIVLPHKYSIEGLRYLIYRRLALKSPLYICLLIGQPCVFACHVLIDWPLVSNAAGVYALVYISDPNLQV